MVKDFKDVYDSFLMERIQEIHISIVLTNPEYMKYANIYAGMYAKIRNALPDKDKHLIQDYEKMEITVEDIAMAITYAQGLKDGLVLKNILSIEKGRMK